MYRIDWWLDKIISTGYQTAKAYFISKVLIITLLYIYIHIFVLLFFFCIRCYRIRKDLFDIIDQRVMEMKWCIWAQNIQLTVFNKIELNQNEAQSETISHWTIFGEIQSSTNAILGNTGFSEYDAAQTSFVDSKVRSVQPTLTNKQSSKRIGFSCISTQEAPLSRDWACP